MQRQVLLRRWRESRDSRSKLLFLQVASRLAPKLGGIHGHVMAVLDAESEPGAQRIG